MHPALFVIDTHERIEELPERRVVLDPQLEKLTLEDGAPTLECR